MIYDINMEWTLTCHWWWCCICPRRSSPRTARRTWRRWTGRSRTGGTAPPGQSEMSIEYCGSSSTNHSSPGRRPAPRSCGWCWRGWGASWPHRAARWTPPGSGWGCSARSPAAAARIHTSWIIEFLSFHASRSIFWHYRYCVLFTSTISSSLDARCTTINYIPWSRYSFHVNTKFPSVILMFTELKFLLYSRNLKVKLSKIQKKTNIFVIPFKFTSINISEYQICYSLQFYLWYLKWTLNVFKYFLVFSELN